MSRCSLALFLAVAGVAHGAFIARAPAAAAYRGRRIGPLTAQADGAVGDSASAAAAAEPPPVVARGAPPGGRPPARPRPGGPKRDSMLLSGPMYVQRKKPLYTPRPEGRGRGDGGRGRGDGGRGRGEGRGRGAPSSSFGGLSAPSFGGGDDAPAADSGSDRSAAAGKKFASPPRRGGKDAYGEKRNEFGKSQKTSKAKAWEDLRTATARAPRKKGKTGKKSSAGPPPPPKGPTRISLGADGITVGDLAAALDVGAAVIVKDLMRMGVLASITQSISAEVATTIAEGMGAEVSGAGGDEEGAEQTGLGVLEEDDEEELLVRRPPVVTIMGHVDHGKTSLLDALRSASVADGEDGGITQHLGAYKVALPGGADGETVTFIDTPGHAAFSEMRSRGANVTDIVVLVVAADDGVKEQTIQSIRAAKAAGVPIVVAVNKVDKPGADAQKVKTQLLEHEVVLEEFGGEVLSALVSAKEGTGLDALLEQLQLSAEVLDLRANPDRLATGTVIEARQAQGQGAVATVLVQRGTLRVGDIVVAGSQWGRVRSLADESDERLEAAGPSEAVSLVGLSGLPMAGDQLTATPGEARARELAEIRQRLERDARTSNLFADRSSSDRELFLGGLKDGELPTKLLDFVVRCDVQGSAEALSSALGALTAADDKLQVRTRVLRSGAGSISAEDVMLASVSNALVVGFNSFASAQTRAKAAEAGVQIKEYSVVYNALDDVEAMMAALIRPPPNKQLGTLVGTLDVKQIFKIGAIGKVAGCSVLDGYIKVGCNIRILRGNLILYEGKLQSLRSVKEAVDQVDAPAECGLSFDDFQGMEPVDRVEAYLPRAGVGDDEEGVSYGGSKVS